MSDGGLCCGAGVFGARLIDMQARSCRVLSESIAGWWISAENKKEGASVLMISRFA